MFRDLRKLMANLNVGNEEEALEEIAQRVVREGMGTAAILFLESSKPLGFIAGQLTIAATPLIGGFIEPMRLEGYANLLSNRDFIERLIRRIEELEADRAGFRKKDGEADKQSSK